MKHLLQLYMYKKHNVETYNTLKKRYTENLEKIYQIKKIIIIW